MIFFSSHSIAPPSSEKSDQLHTLTENQHWAHLGEIAEIDQVPFCSTTYFPGKCHNAIRKCFHDLVEVERPFWAWFQSSCVDVASQNQDLNTQTYGNYLQCWTTLKHHFFCPGLQPHVCAFSRQAKESLFEPFRQVDGFDWKLSTPKSYDRTYASLSNGDEKSVIPISWTKESYCWCYIPILVLGMAIYIISPILIDYITLHPLLSTPRSHAIEIYYATAQSSACARSENSNGNGQSWLDASGKATDGAVTVETSVGSNFEPREALGCQVGFRVSGTDRASWNIVGISGFTLQAWSGNLRWFRKFMARCAIILK